MHAAPRAASAWPSNKAANAESTVWPWRCVTLVDGHQGLVAVQRLKTRPQFQAALAGGTVARTQHFALHRITLDVPRTVQNANIDMPQPAKPPGHMLFGEPAIWLGAMVPKRWARRAVTRNAIKRQIYNVSQLFEGRLSFAAHVVRLRATFDRQQYTSATSEPLKLAVRLELEQLFARALRQEAAA